METIVKSVIPKKEFDSLEKESNRATFDKYSVYLSKNQEIYEKILKRLVFILSDTKTDETILQSILIRDLPKMTLEQSLAASAQAIYNLFELGVVNMELFTASDNSKYFRVSLGNEYENKLYTKKIIRRIEKKAKRLVQYEPSEKVGRNNRHGLYSFNKLENQSASKAATKLNQTKIRLYIPENATMRIDGRNIDITPHNIALYIFKQDPDTKIFDELVKELTYNNGKAYYVRKTLDRALRIYGFKWLDITAPSSFRPFLRLSRKRKLTKDGYNEIQAWINENQSNYDKWFIDEVKSLKVGSYTNIMMEVDANNQGPSIIAALMEDKHMFIKYWGSETSPKMYDLFKNQLLDNLGLPLDTLTSKDVKYKIMTKGYNKQDSSNIFGDKAFISGLENSYLEGLYMNSFEFYELPLKVQLEQKLGSDYNFTDDQLVDAYKLAIDKVAPFLEKFKMIFDEFQNNLLYKPSIYRFTATDGDVCYSARSTNRSVVVPFIDKYGQNHSVMYNYKTVVQDNGFGGETALSPSIIASIDAWLARTIINDFHHDIITNHDAFFVHPNDSKDVKAMYIELFAKIPEYGKKLFAELNTSYGCSKLACLDSLYDVVNVSEVNRLGSEDIMRSKNLIG
jgi:hypothetical protein